MRNVKTHLFILLCCLASVFALTFAACSSAQNTKPAASHVVSVDKTDSDGETDSYTMKFSDGSTYVFSVESDESGKLHVIDFRDKLYVSVNGIKTLDPNMFADNLHLSAAGYALWESEIRRVIFDSDGV